VWLCRRCDYAFVDPLPDRSVLERAYDRATYYEEWVTTQAQRRQVMWRRRAGRVLRGLRSGRLLDVGCGEGSFLHEAKMLGWQVEGSEISNEGCRLAKSRWDIEPFCGEVAQAPWPPASFDVVTLWHVVEHVPDPVSLMQTVAQLTAPGGRIIVACPNRRSYLFNLAYRIGRGRPPHLFHPDDRELHLSHFTVSSLRRLLELQSLRVIRVDVDQGHVQPIQWMLDLLATGLHTMTGLVWSQAIELWALKP